MGFEEQIGAYIGVKMEEKSQKKEEEENDV